MCVKLFDRFSLKGYGCFFMIDCSIGNDLVYKNLRLKTLYKLHLGFDFITTTPPRHLSTLPRSSFLFPSSRPSILFLMFFFYYVVFLLVLPLLLSCPALLSKLLIIITYYYILQQIHFIIIIFF